MPHLEAHETKIKKLHDMTFYPIMLKNRKVSINKTAKVENRIRENKR